MEGDNLFNEGDRANAARIVKCVNACAGMENPAEEIQRLRDDRRRLAGALAASNPYVKSSVSFNHTLYEHNQQLLTEMEESK